MDYIQSKIKRSSHVLQLEHNRNEVEGGIVNMRPTFVAQSELAKAIQEKENRDNTTGVLIQRKCCNNLVQKCSTPVQQAVIQRAKEDISDTLWQKCTELLSDVLTDNKTLDKTKESDLLFVLDNLEKLSPTGVVYATLLKAVILNHYPSKLKKLNSLEDLDNISLDELELELKLDLEEIDSSSGGNTTSRYFCGIEVTESNKSLFTRLLSELYVNAPKESTTYYYTKKDRIPTVTFRCIIDGKQVSAHVHYRKDGLHGSFAGKAWIQDIEEFDFPTPTSIVVAAPVWKDVSALFPPQKSNPRKHT